MLKHIGRPKVQSIAPNPAYAALWKVLHIRYNGLGCVVWNGLLITAVKHAISKDLVHGTDFAKY
jgi:hypothetical protein